MEITFKFMKENEYKTVENYPQKARFTSAKFIHTVLRQDVTRIMSQPITNSREILMEFFRNAEINLQPVYRPPPLNKNRREGGLYTGYQSSASKGYCVTDVRVMPLFCTAHPLLSITLLHPRWRRFFPLSRKEQTRAAFAELKL